MTIKLNVGVSRKVGQPNYGSLGACCNVDVEVDQQTLTDDPQGLHRRVQEAFAVCRQAVEAELSQCGSRSDENGSALSHDSQPRDSSSRAASSSAPRAATAAQVKAIHAIAGRMGVRLADRLQPLGVRSPSQLTLRQASRLIDELKQSLTPTSA